MSPTYGCGGCADAPVFTVAVQLDDKNYSVEAEYGPSPDRLKPVLSTLEGISEHAFD